MHIAEIISVGTELLFGEITDTNAAFLAKELTARGILVAHKCVVGDDVSSLQAAITQALDRADLVILGGGLGPTADDLTREAIAAALNETPREDEALLSWLEGVFASRGRTMSPLNRKQTWLIPSARPLHNHCGTAPGWWVTVKDSSKVVVALPGPPREMKTMWYREVLPRLPLFDHFQTTLHTLGLGESDLAERLLTLTLEDGVMLGTYARATGVDVRLSGRDEAAVSLATKQARTLLADWIWGENDDHLNDVLANKLAGRSLGIIDSLGGALVAGLYEQAIPFEGIVTSRQSLSPQTDILLHAFLQDNQDGAVQLQVTGSDLGSRSLILQGAPDPTRITLAALNLLFSFLSSPVSQEKP